MKYFGFCDPSGGSSDSMTLAIARTSILGNKVVLVGVWERKAPFNPDVVTKEFSGVLKDYGISTVEGDHYGGEWPTERFRAHDITYRTSKHTKSEIFLQFLVLTNSGRVRIPANKRLRAQLVSLERRTSRSGKDTVDHPPGGHDDVANAAAGALVLAAAGLVTHDPICEVIRIDATPYPKDERELQNPFNDFGFGARHGASFGPRR